MWTYGAGAVRKALVMVSETVAKPERYVEKFMELPEPSYIIAFGLL